MFRKTIKVPLKESIVIHKLCENIFYKRIYQDFKVSHDKYPFLIDLKSTISGYPRKLQRFILAFLQIEV